MKNLLIICTVFLLGGCAMGTTEIPYATSVPSEQFCTLRIVPTLTVTQFNGETVKWNGGFNNWGAVRIPQGNHTFVLDYSAAHGHQNGILFTGGCATEGVYSMVAQPASQTSIKILVIKGAL